MPTCEEPEPYWIHAGEKARWRQTSRPSLSSGR